jgi:arylsulfatase A-like enzyme
VPPDDSKGVHVPDHLKTNPEEHELLPSFQGAIRNMDRAIKTIWDGLEREGLADNTLFIYTTDHGIEFAKAKTYLYDAGTEVALIMRWPQGGLTAGRQCDWLLNNVDIFPTVLELAGVPVPEGIDGSSFAACFDLSAAAGGRDAVFSHFPDIHVGAREARAVRTDRYKLIRNFGPTTMQEYGPDHEHIVPPFVQMFDLEKDPSEWINVADDPDYAPARAELDRRLMQWLIDVDDAILHGPRPDPYVTQSIADCHGTSDVGVTEH